MSAAVWVAVAMAILMVPPLIAWHRKVSGAGAILLLVVLAGWTVVGWVFALIWACMAPSRSAAEAERLALKRLSGYNVRPSAPVSAEKPEPPSRAASNSEVLALRSSLGTHG